MFGFGINNSFNVEFHCLILLKRINGYVYSRKEICNLSSCYGNYILLFTRLSFARKKEKFGND